MRRKGGSFSPERHRRKTQTRLILSGLVVLLVVGGGLVWAIYGRSAAITAVLCLLGAAGVFGVLWLILALLEMWVKEEEP